MKKIIVLKTTTFLVIFSIMLLIVHKIMFSPGEWPNNYERIGEFYKEEEMSLDAVYIGASMVYASWNSSIAWNKFGITVFPFCTGSQPLDAALYMIKAAREKQPNALYIINICTMYDAISENQIYWMIKDMPFSMNRIDLINELCDINKTSQSERFEFYFPLYRFHSRWDELRKNDFHYNDNVLKGECTDIWFLNGVKNVTSSFRRTTRRIEIRQSLQEEIEKLIDYCNAEGVRVLFVIAPQARTNEVFWAKINTIIDLIESRGYPCLNMLDCIEEIGLNFETDYTGELHTNLHGALKTTKFLAEYLVNNYNFVDKRGETNYYSWDKAFKRYTEIIAPYVLDIETNYEKRDYMMVTPKLNKINVNGTALTISWASSSGAEGYRIYRKEENSAWKKLVDVKSETRRYTDKKCKINKKYTYTVVPWHIVDGTKAWGNFDIKGVDGKAMLGAPEVVSLDKVNNGVKITWKKLRDAAGYKLFRKLPDKNWSMLKDVGNTDSYVDTEVLENLPFCYTVQGYTLDKNNKKIDGNQNPTGLLYLPELTMPTVVAVVNNGKVTLTWDTAEGMSGYKIYRNGELIEDLPANAVKFTDKPGDGQHKYSVKAFFKFNSNVHIFDLNNSFEWVVCK